MRNQHRFSADGSLDGLTAFHQRACTYPWAISPPFMMKHGVTPELHNQGGEIPLSARADPFPFNRDTRMKTSPLRDLEQVIR